MTNHDKNRRQGQRLLDKEYIPKSRAARAAIKPEQLAAYREQILREVDRRLSVIVASIEEYGAGADQHRYALAELVSLLAAQLLAIDELLRTLVEVEALRQ